MRTNTITIYGYSVSNDPIINNLLNNNLGPR